MPTKFLYELARQWEQEARSDSRDSYPFLSVLEEVLFHGEWRFHEFSQYQEEGAFPARLKRWLDNLSDGRHKKALFTLLPFITFIDRKQMASLYADAFRRILAPWLLGSQATREDLLSCDFELRIRERLKTYVLLSITESFNLSEFLHVNDLSGLPRPRVLGESREAARLVVDGIRRECNSGAIVFEDFVGSGSQAKAVLAELRAGLDTRSRIICIPQIILERGLNALRREASGIDIEPVVVIPDCHCLREAADAREPAEFTAIRSLVQTTSKRALQSLDALDDPPRDPFGYGGCGMLLVTCHNAPNNTLPIIHHRAPNWSPLFRRVHHAKDSL